MRHGSVLTGVPGTLPSPMLGNVITDGFTGDVFGSAHFGILGRMNSNRRP